MKTLRFKVFGFAAMALLLAATVVSCSKDDEEKKAPSVAEAIAGTYTGGEYANAKFFKKWSPSADAKAEIKVEEDETATLVYTSQTWGTFTFNNINIANDNNIYSLSGESSSIDLAVGNMPGGHAASRADEQTNGYTATFAAVIENGKMVATITAAIGAMGDVEILFNPADFDEILNAPSSK